MTERDSNHTYLEYKSKTLPLHQSEYGGGCGGCGGGGSGGGGGGGDDVRQENIIFVYAVRLIILSVAYHIAITDLII